MVVLQALATQWTALTVTNQILAVSKIDIAVGSEQIKELTVFEEVEKATQQELKLLLKAIV